MDGAPIFLLGIQRGGTNQALNILRSHPRTGWPEGEFHEIFRGRGLRRGLRQDGAGRTLRKWLRYAPILLSAGDLLDPTRPPARRLGAAGGWVASGLAASAAENRAGVERYKAALRARGYIDAGPAPDRMVVKLVNYNLHFAEDLAALYPGARFVGLIRDGRAVCEGFAARGAGIAEAAAAYAFVGRRLIDLEAAGLAIKVWRFEDLIADPPAVAREIYGFAGLDPAAARGVCLQDKTRVTDEDGGLERVAKADRFYGFDEMGGHMRADANEGALARLPEAARAEVEARSAPVLAHFGYG